MPKPTDTDTTETPRVITPTVSRETLEETPSRVLPFLRTIGIVPAVHAILAGRGYTAAVHREGWDLLHHASGHTLDEPGAPPAASDERIRHALAEIDDLDETFINIVGATLRRHYPAVAEVVMEGVKPSRGATSVLGVTTLLDRLDTLEAEGTEDGLAAVELIGSRGYDGAERARIRGLLRVAESVPDVVPVDAAAEAAAEERYVQALARLRAWYEEWSTIARNTITRRDHLIRLGLASRRTSGTDEDDLGT